MNRLAVLGFDGLDPFVIEKYINSLPNIKSLIQEGFFSKLQSTMPPITSAAWTSMVTGMNPGKTGVLGFYQKKEGGKQFKSAAFTNVKHPKIWDVVHGYNGKSVVLNMPIPGVSEVKGIYTSGRFGKLQTYPPELKELIEEKGYDNQVIDIINKDSSADELLDEVLKVEYSRLKVGMELIEENNPDLVFFVFNIPDAIHHVVEDEQMLLKLYMMVDKIVAQFMLRFPNLFLVSDHGFSSKSFEYTFNFLGWLVQNDLCKVNSKKIKLKLSAKKILSNMGLYNKNISNELHMMHYDIDWRKSAVFTEPCLPALYVNYECKNYSDSDKLFKEVQSKMENIAYSGKEYKFKLYKREELYHGENLSVLPEFIIDAPEELVFRDTINPDGVFSSPRVWKRNHSKTLTFMGRGEMIRDGIETEGTIYDICPTILYAMGLPILEDIDGDVLDVFSDLYKQENSREFIKIMPSKSEKDKHISKEDNKEIEERLKSLGYL